MSQDKSVAQPSPQAPGPSATPPPDPAQAREMAFFDHLDELRARLVKCLWIFVIGFGAAYMASDQILGFLRRPLFAVLPVGQQKLYFTSLFENFMTHLKISAVASVFFFSPYFFYQLWAFVAPGLY